MAMLFRNEMVNKINHITFKAVYSYTIFKCYIKMLKLRHLMMRGVLVLITATISSQGVVSARQVPTGEGGVPLSGHSSLSHAQ